MGSSRRHVLTFAVLTAGFVIVAACKDPETKPPVGDQGTSPFGSSGGGGGGDGGEAGASSSSGTTSSGGSSGTSSGGDAGSCTSLPNQGNLIDLIQVAGDPPNGTGGTIPEGATYNMSEANAYVGFGGVPMPTDTQLRGQLHFQSGVFERIYTTVVSGNPMPPVTRLRGTYTIANNNQISMHATCPFVVDDLFHFSVDTVANTFMLIDENGKQSWTFQLQ